MEYTKENPLRVFTAFSGYDSQCLALKRLGIPYELVAFSEIDKYAIQAHDALFPEWKDRNYGDISKIDWNEVPYFDLFTYSFPCTNLSFAGKQEGCEEESGTASSLLWECRQAIKAKKPKYLLMENVKAFVSSKFLPYFNKWQSELASYGYSNFAKVLNARDYNVPQNRERIFMVSILNFDGIYHFPKPFPLERRLKDVLEENVDESYYLSKKLAAGFLKHNDVNEERGCGFKSEPIGADCIVVALRGREAAALTPKRNEYGKKMRKAYESGELKESRHYMQQLEPRIDGITNTITTVQKDNLIIEPKQVIGSTQKHAYVGSVEGVSPCLNVASGMGGGHVPMIVGMTVSPARKFEYDDGRIHTDISPCITTQEAKHTSLIYRSDFRIRKLTERECFRLMDVDDSDIDKIQAAGISKTQQYKLAGNSIVINVLFHIFRKLFIDKENENKQLTLF